MLSEVSRLQKDHCRLIPLLGGSLSSQKHRDRKEKGSYQGLGGGGGWSNWEQFPSGKIESSGDKWQGRLHNNVNRIYTHELDT